MSPTKDRKRSPARSFRSVSIRRLEDRDVRAVFESLHDGKPPPPHLPFQIVPVGPKGLKLSPPSHEFPDGLYVLLRPQSKNKNNQSLLNVPPHLQEFVVEDLPSETCPWSLSGPQFPQPTAIQQRYCYPKGRSEYSSRKGGALWTMYKKDGKEDLEFRLLHVYFSAKRAVNKGVSSSPPKRQRREANPLRSPPKKRLPAIPAASCSPIAASLDDTSQLSFELFPLPSPPRPFHQMPPLANPNFISPPYDVYVRDRALPSSDCALLTPSPIPDRAVFRRSSPHGMFKPDYKIYEPLAYHFEMGNEMDALWNYPLFNLMPTNEGTSESVRNLATKLSDLHESLVELIFCAPHEEQAGMVHVLACWARRVAEDPFVNPNEDSFTDTNDDGVFPPFRAAV